MAARLTTVDQSFPIFYTAFEFVRLDIRLPCSAGNSRDRRATLIVSPTMKANPYRQHKEEFHMTRFSNLFAAAAAILTIIAATSTAQARGGKDVYIQDYQFAKPMHGYSGHSGNYYCDYQRLPNRKCFINASGTETCKIVGWTLREMCQ
jgi:hypothetical protein